MSIKKLIKRCLYCAVILAASFSCAGFAEEFYVFFNYADSSAVYCVYSDRPNTKPNGFVFSGESALFCSIDNYSTFRLVTAVQGENTLDLTKAYYRGAVPDKVLSESLGQVKTDLEHISFASAPNISQSEIYFYTYEADKPGRLYADGQPCMADITLESLSESNRILCALPNYCFAVWGSDIVKEFLTALDLIDKHPRAVCTLACVYQRTGSPLFEASVFSKADNTLYRFTLLAGTKAKPVSCEALKLRFYPSAISYDRSGVLYLISQDSKPKALKTPSDFDEAFVTYLPSSSGEGGNDDAEQFYFTLKTRDNQRFYCSNPLILERIPVYPSKAANLSFYERMNFGIENHFAPVYFEGLSGGKTTEVKGGCLVLAKQHYLTLYTLLSEDKKPKRTAKLFLGNEYMFARFDSRIASDYRLASEYSRKKQFEKLIKSGVSLSTVPFANYKSTYSYPKSLMFTYFSTPYF